MKKTICKYGHPIGTITTCLSCICHNNAKKVWSNPSEKLKSASAKNRPKSTPWLNSAENKEKRKAYFNSDLHKSRARAAALKLTERIRNGEIKGASKKHDTKPELSVERILNTFSIKYLKQYQIGPYTTDFYLPDYNMVLEVDGEYWHNRPRNIANDISKETYLINNNYRIRHIHELETLKKGEIDRIISEITNKSHVQINIDFKDLCISVIDDASAIEFLKQYHYLPRFRKTTRAVHGVKHQNELIGVIIYAQPSYNTISKAYSVNSKQILELARFVLHDNYHVKNLASWSLSKSIKLIRQNNKDIKLITTFADPFFGHDGKIYLAANFQSGGETRPSYFYADPNGSIVHKKTVWDHATKMKDTEENYAAANNLRRINTPPKHRFIYWL